MIYVMILCNPCLYIPCNCMILVNVVLPSFLPFLMTTRLYNLLKLQTKTSCVFPQVRRIFSEKQYSVMWQVLWLSPSPEQARPYVEASERKLRDVGFLELVDSQGRKSKNSKEVSSNFNQSFFQNSYSKLRNWFPCFYFHFRKNPLIILKISTN